MSVSGLGGRSRVKRAAEHAARRSYTKVSSDPRARRVIDAGLPLVRRAYQAAERRLSAVPARLDAVEDLAREINAGLESSLAAHRRLRLQADRLAEELRAEIRTIDHGSSTAVALLIGELSNGEKENVAAELAHRFAHAQNYTDTVVRTEVGRLERQVADIRSGLRFTQATIADGLARGSGGESENASVGADVAVQPPASAPPAVRYEHATPTFDVLYTGFENAMRGSQDLIRSRQEADYLDLLTGLASPELPIVDLGCGRGELVSILADAGAVVIGVDSNAAQVFESAASRISEADLFTWLDQRDDNSVRAIVSLHVVEHLPLDLQVRLVHEARRVLVPGGALVLETPNASSIVVGASTFWVDPTHERPVHPEFLRFLAEDAGFVDVDVRLLHPQPLSFTGPEQVAGLVAELNGLILAPADVALIARTPEDTAS